MTSSLVIFGSALDDDSSLVIFGSASVMLQRSLSSFSIGKKNNIVASSKALGVRWLVTKFWYQPVSVQVLGKSLWRW